MDNPYTDAQWYKMCDVGLGRPVPLHTADLSSTWVYYRPWGLMHVPSGYHSVAMATLYAFHHGFPDYLAVAHAEDVKLYRAMATFADAFLMDIPGTAFKSGVGTHAICGHRDSLDAAERQAFRNAKLIVNALED